jgi:hypothetical protein
MAWDSMSNTYELRNPLAYKIVIVSLTRIQKTSSLDEGAKRNFCSTRDSFENVLGDEGAEKQVCGDDDDDVCMRLRVGGVLVCRFHESRTGVHRVVQVGECVFILCTRTHCGLRRVRT